MVVYVFELVHLCVNMCSVSTWYVSHDSLCVVCPMCSGVSACAPHAHPRLLHVRICPKE